MFRHNNGDNGDYKPIAKGYHGIRIFTGSKDGTYKETLFLPMNGAFKAVVEDFDQDNDLDIAAISYFPDYKNRDEEGFVFFENKGNQVFHRSTIPESRSGKWLVMDVGDIDNDGDYLTDILTTKTQNFIKSMIKNNLFNCLCTTIMSTHHKLGVKI